MGSYNCAVAAANQLPLSLSNPSLQSHTNPFITMKALFVVCLTFAMTLAEFRIQTGEDLGKYRGECVTQLNIPAEKVDQFKQWKFEEGDACYIECILNKMGLFDEATGFNVDNLVEQLGQSGDKTEIRSKVEPCADKNTAKDDKCKWAFRGFKCFQTNHLSLIKTSVAKKD